MKLNKRKLLSSIKDWNIIGAGKLSYHLSRLIIPKPTNELILETLHGFKLKIDPVNDNGVERSIYYFGTYEKGTLYVIGQILKEGDTFVDVGANIGLMSIYASQKVKDSGIVISFEPNPNTRTIFEENISLNGISNIKVEGFALSDENKKSIIYDRWDVNRGGASLIKPTNPSESYDTEEITFSNYFKNDKVLKLIKIDVEGYELNVLKGASQFIKNSSIPSALIVEFSSLRNNSFGKETLPLFNFLKELDIYKFYKSTYGKERISKLVEITHEKDLPSHDNIYCFTKEHINELPKVLFKSQQ